jgi:hypothetical protein
MLIAWFPKSSANAFSKTLFQEPNSLVIKTMSLARFSTPHDIDYMFMVFVESQAERFRNCYCSWRYFGSRLIMYVDSVGSSFFIISFVNVEHNSGLTKEPNERFPSEKPFMIRSGSTILDWRSGFTATSTSSFPTQRYSQSGCGLVPKSWRNFHPRRC